MTKKRNTEEPEEVENAAKNSENIKTGEKTKTGSGKKTQKATKSKKVKAPANDEASEGEGVEVKEVKKESPEEIIKELKDKYLRLSAEFDNYRKRTLKEKMDLVKSAGEQVLINLLPVIDDFDRAQATLDAVKDIDAFKEGIDLIYNKLKGFLNQNGVKEIEALNKKFDTDLHEAVTKISAPNKKMKGKVIDVIEKGYYLNDKILRFSKVVVGE